MIVPGEHAIVAIIRWCRKYHPELVESVETIIDEANPSYLLLLTLGFESGRMFQSGRELPYIDPTLEDS